LNKSNIDILRAAVKQPGPVLHNCPPNFPLKETLTDLFQLVEIYTFQLQKLEQTPNFEVQDLKERVEQLEKKQRNLESQLYRSWGGTCD
jgi:hypothetical protein